MQSWQLHHALEQRGFHQFNNGGGCRAMARRRGEFTDVLTTTCGGGLPEERDWLLVAYRGDWLSNVDSATEVDCLDSELSPVHLLEAVDLLTEAAQ